MTTSPISDILFTVSTEERETAKNFLVSQLGFTASEVSPTTLYLGNGTKNSFMLSTDEYEKDLSQRAIFYVTVDSIDESVAKITTLGGSTYRPKEIMEGMGSIQLVKVQIFGIVADVHFFRVDILPFPPPLQRHTIPCRSILSFPPQYPIEPFPLTPS